MNIYEIFAQIELPQEVTGQLEPVLKSKLFAGIPAEYILGLSTPQLAEESNNKLAQYLSQAPEEQRWLYTLGAHLTAATIQQATYRRLGIPQDIFCATMKIFTRFCGEYKKAFGIPGFDRGFWTWRQTAGLLYRIGELEYEMVRYSDTECGSLVKDALVLSVHIPSDAKISRDALTASYTAAQEFFARYFPQFRYTAMYCETWLLSPTLREILKPGSGILAFQQDYELLLAQPESDAANEWLFGRKRIPLEQLPENTSLQRTAKGLLANGKHMGAGIGVVMVDGKALQAI